MQTVNNHSGSPAFPSSSANQTIKQTKQSNNSPTVPPLTNEHLFVITELAKIGLGYLKQIVANEAFKVDNPDPKVAEAQEEHFRGLATIAGPETVSHFDRMCQYIYEEQQKAKEAPDAKA